MKAVVQRVRSASVTIEDEVVGEIGPGLLVLLGVATPDTDEDATWMARKIAGLRIFPDDAGRMNVDLAAAWLDSGRHADHAPRRRPTLGH